MDKDNSLVLVTPDDIAFLEGELSQTRRPFSLHELTGTLAFRKTAGQRSEVVKIYDPGAAYAVGDSVYKEYDEPLTVGSRVQEHFQGSVVLKVVGKTVDKALDCDMLEVDYTGGGPFRKYVDYMAKTKTLVLLPSNCGLAGEAPKIMVASSDPRLTELPMTERDVRTLERNLRAAMAKSAAFFAWGDRWQLKANPPAVPDETIKSIAARISGQGRSSATTDLIREFFGLEPSSDLFEIHCLWLNHLLETKHKKEFVSVSPVEWGKWHLKASLAAMPEGLPLSASEAKLPEFDPAEKVEVAPFHEFPLKVYLGWREILSGGVKIPRWYNKELSHSREYTFTNAEEKAVVTAYFFPQLGYFLGLKEYFAAANIPQGTSMTLEKSGPAGFQFWIKKAKKKIQVAKVAYDTAADTFADAGEAPTMALPNKIIYIERDHLAKVFAMAAEREGKDLRELLIPIFKMFNVHSTLTALHYLRAYHLVDLIQRTTQEDVELVLLNTPEFIKSDKKKGEFFYREAVPEKALVIEEEPAAAVERPAVILSPEDMALAEATAEHAEPIDEVAIADALELEISPEEEARRAALAALNLVPRSMPIRDTGRPPARPSAPVPGVPAKKEVEKKKIRFESDRRPKTRKSERRVLEESILDRESERAAMSAVKDGEEDILAELGAFLPTDDSEETETTATAASTAPAAHAAAGHAKAAPKTETETEVPEEGAEEAAAESEPAPAPGMGGGMFGGMLADRLKAALKKKREEVALEEAEGDKKDE
ncbi:MAG: hypothetical protein NTZ26_04685 [Candidatus Aminicenantes bacterium]|nr:hypothetical protein [Candidatus Aminicenantes bacterium]